MLRPGELQLLCLAATLVEAQHKGRLLHEAGFGIAAVFKFGPGYQILPGADHDIAACANGVNVELVAQPVGQHLF